MSWRILGFRGWPFGEPNDYSLCTIAAQTDSKNGHAAGIKVCCRIGRMNGGNMRCWNDKRPPHCGWEKYAVIPGEVRARRQIRPASDKSSAESQEIIRQRVVVTRNVQLRRFFDEYIYSNAQMGWAQIRKHCVLTPECEKIMENAITKLGFSARGYDRILKVARTIADLENYEDLTPIHLSEAVQYCTFDRNLWV